MQTSTHYGFNLPGANDFVDIEDLTENWSSVDNILYNSGTKRVVCSTAVSTAAKTASTSGGDFEKRTDAQIIVRFTNGNTAANPTLNIDNTGAAPIYVNGEAAEKLPADGVFLFVYNGTQFELVGGVSSGVGGGSMIVITDTTSEHEFEGDTVTATVGAYSESAVVSGGTATITGFMETGTVTITATDFSQTISITNYNKYTVSLVKPSVDMYVDWLNSINEPSTSYSSLADVLADEKMVRELFTRHASVDFLVSNVGNYPEELETIINNDYCAKWINLRDYALDTLYANQLIASLMDQADKYFYGEWTIVDNTTTPPTWGPKGNVPVMTSNTAPYGEASADKSYNADFAPWKLFAQDGNIYGWSPGSPGDHYVTFKFTCPVCVKRVVSTFRNDTTTIYKILASNDNTNWQDLTEQLTYTGTGQYEKTTIPVDNNDYYLYYRINITAVGDYVPSMKILQFYGRESRGTVPTMTSDTAPYGVVSASSRLGDFRPYQAFDGVTTTDTNRWVSNSFSNDYIQYKFVNPVCVKRIRIKQFSTSSGRTPLDCTAKIQGSNDGNLWTDIETLLFAASDMINLTYYDVNNDNSYLYYRLQYLSANLYAANTYYAQVYFLQFYGFDYSEYDWDTNNPRHYIYDHGVELEDLTLVGSVSRNSDCLKLIAANDQASKLLDTTDYTLLRGVVGANASGTNVLLCGSGSATFTADYMPYNQSLDVSSINSTNATGVKQTAAGTFDAAELWLE